MTFFAPSDSAIKEYFSIPHLDMDISEYLSYHLLDDKYEMKDLTNDLLLETTLTTDGLEGESQKIKVKCHFGYVLLNRYSYISEGDLTGSNGVLHIIERVLSPPLNVVDTAFMIPSLFSTFSSAIAQTGLVDLLHDAKSITAFLPTNRAWLVADLIGKLLTIREMFERERESCLLT